jgi:hypothetical protein
LYVYHDIGTPCKKQKLVGLTQQNNVIKTSCWVEKWLFLDSMIHDGNSWRRKNMHSFSGRRAHFCLPQ